MMMDKKFCDRCHKPLNGCSIMSMFNEDIICMKCKMEEKKDPRYEKALKAERDACAHGNFNFKGIGW